MLDAGVKLDNDKMDMTFDAMYNFYLKLTDSQKAHLRYV